MPSPSQPIRRVLTTLALIPGLVVGLPLVAIGQAADFELVANPNSVNFGDVTVGSSSSRDVVISHTRTDGSVTVDSVMIQPLGIFAVTVDQCTGTTMAPTESCELVVTATPNDNTPFSATLTVASGAQSVEVPLSVNGVAPNIDPEPDSLDFGDEPVGFPSQPQTVTFTNRGTGPIDIDTLTIEGGQASDYSRTTDCVGARLEVGDSCSADIRFTPAAVGGRDASLSLDAQGAPDVASVALTGSGHPLQPDAIALDFGNVPIGGQSGIEDVIISNISGSPQTITGVGLGGSDAEQFAISEPTTCNDTAGGAVLLAGAACSVSLFFAPRTVGVKRGQLLIHVTGADPLVVELTGTGVGSADVGITKSDSQDPAPTARNLTYTLTVTNNGPDPASTVLVTDTLPSSVTFVSVTPSQGTCEPPDGNVIRCHLGTIASGGTATVSIVVKPTQAGTITNTASVDALELDSASANDVATEQTSVCRITSRRTSISCP